MDLFLVDSAECGWDVSSCSSNQYNHFDISLTRAASVRSVLIVVILVSLHSSTDVFAVSFDYLLTDAVHPRFGP